MHDVIGNLSQHAHCAITPQWLVKSPKSILPFHWLPDRLSADVSGMSQLWEDSLTVIEVWARGRLGTVTEILVRQGFWSGGRKSLGILVRGTIYSEIVRYQNPRGTISEILVRSRPPRTKITGVGPKSLVILVQRTKIPAEQYRRFWSARTKIPVTGLWLVG